MIPDSRTTLSSWATSAEANDPDFTPAPVERDRRWRVIVRRVPEADS